MERLKRRQSGGTPGLPRRRRPHPFLKVRGGPGPFTPVDLAVQCGRPLLLRQPIPAPAVDQVILGCVNVLADEMNPARVAALRLGLGERCRAFSVQINCGSGMHSIDTAAQLIREGARELVLAGGTEALSQAPLQLRPEAAQWLGELRHADSLGERVRQFAELRPDFFKPVLSLKRGLTDPIVGLSMGETAEVLGHLFAVSRKEADAYAVASHHRLHRAQTEGFLETEVAPAISPKESSLPPTTASAPTPRRPPSPNSPLSLSPPTAG